MFIKNDSKSARFHVLQLANSIKTRQIHNLTPNTALPHCLKRSGRRAGTQQDVKAMGWDMESYSSHCLLLTSLSPVFLG